MEKWLAGRAHRRLWAQLTMLALSLVGLLVVILALPINDSTRGQLLSLLGIVLSAAIALSSTSLIGNAMAGLMLRATRSFRSGDFSVSYRIGGLLTDVKQLLSTRSQLREGLLDELHGAGIEIVSPTFMNTRPIPDGKVFIPSAPTGASADEEAKKPLESLVFDKAEEAEKVEEVRERFRALGEELEEIEKSFGEASEDAERKRLEARKEQLASERQRLEEALESAAESEDAPEAAQTAPPEEAATGG